MFNAVVKQLCKFTPHVNIIPPHIKVRHDRIPRIFSIFSPSFKEVSFNLRLIGNPYTLARIIFTGTRLMISRGFWSINMVMNLVFLLSRIELRKAASDHNIMIRHCKVTGGPAIEYPSCRCRRIINNSNRLPIFILCNRREVFA